jgi:hypothetical protein
MNHSGFYYAICELCTGKTVLPVEPFGRQLHHVLSRHSSNPIPELSKMWQYCKKLFVHFFVHALRAIAYCGSLFPIDMNALRAIAYYGSPFPIDMNTLRAIAYCGSPFSIDMNALRAIEGISRRETISIERIHWMYCVVRRTLTTKSERKFINNDL